MSEAEAQQQRLCELVRLRLENGDARPIELARAEEEREELSLEANALRNEARLRKERMNLWLGGKLPATFVVEPEREAPSALPDIAESLRRAAEHPSAKTA